MSGRNLLVSALVSLFTCAGVGYAAPLDSVVDAIQKSYDAVEDIEARFVQESVVTSWNARQTQRAEGTVYFKKEGKMFWDYQSPIPQQIISNGKKLWFYEPEERQVTVTAVGEGLQSQISADLLNGKAKLTRDFEIREIKSTVPSEKGFLVLELIPRTPQPTLSRVILKLNRESYRIQQTEVYDLFDNLNRITYSQMKINNNLADSLFAFTPPSGVEVLNPPSLPLPQP